MNVLFVSSGNTLYGISPITRSQGVSLGNFNVEVFYFPIVGKGLRSYLIHIVKLKKHLSVKKYDLIHAHYSLAGFVATLAGSKPLVVSLMGSDSKHGFFSNLFIKFFSVFFWRECIVKSKEMRESLNLRTAFLIPNGVDIVRFIPMQKETAQNLLGWGNDKKHILFGANVNRPEKNFTLTQAAIKKIGNKNVETHALNNIDPVVIPLLLNASDVVMLTSLWEGSPNVIKEAMACNRPIVSTDVGDVRWLFGDLHGHYLTGFEPGDVADKIMEAINFSHDYQHTNGRDRIIQLELDSNSVAKRIVEIYSQILKR